MLPITYIIGLAFFLIIFGVFIALVAYVKSTKHIATDQVADDRMNQRAQQEALQILNLARARSVEILGNANQNAQAIIDNAHVIDTNYKAELKAQMQHVFDTQKGAMQQSSEDMITQWQKQLDTVRTEDTQVFKSIAQTIEHEAVKEIADFKSILLQETLSSQHTVQEKLEQAYKEVETELIAYRKEQKEKIEQNATTALSDVAKTVIGKVLRMDEHEELIMESLEKAKKDNLL